MMMKGKGNRKDDDEDDEECNDESSKKNFSILVYTENNICKIYLVL